MCVQENDVCFASVEGKLVACKHEPTLLLFITHLHGGRKLSSFTTMMQRSAFDWTRPPPFRPPFPCEVAPAVNLGVIVKETNENLNFV